MIRSHFRSYTRLASLPPLILGSETRCDGGKQHALPGLPDVRAIDRIGLEWALSRKILPLERAGSVTPVAASSLEIFRQSEPELSAELGPIAYTWARASDVENTLLGLRGASLALRAERRTAARESCRSWSGTNAGLILVALLALACILASAVPGLLVAGATAWAAVTLISVTALRSLGALTELRHARRQARLWSSVHSKRLAEARLPTISILVPLLDEKDIAGRLVRRLKRLDYPRDRLEVCLVLEAGDRTTEAAVAAADLPEWMRIVRVPAGPLRTKPRAMNYALDFTRGEIVGIYDAEDRPAPDQLHRVAAAFARAAPDVACLQGVLDFYNPHQSWLTRCFTIDYATWFRLVLPGLVRLGLPIPLGGTTIFLWRDILESLGRWDAHNVTEDADLGLRLARRGYRTEFIQTVTEEEATAEVSAWIRQRSRWIKGYAMTWAVHMRDPLRALGDFGLLRFIAVQILFLGTLSQFFLAPVLWSFWLILFGVPHPITEFASWNTVVALGALFFLTEVATMTTAALSVASHERRWLIKWVPLMHVYWPLAALASWKALIELITRPFYWDKTAHGRAFIPRPEDRPSQPLRHPA